MLGGQDIREVPLGILREQVAVVTQDTYLFHGTVADNLRFGNPNATQEELEAAAQAANAHEFICQLNHGYETVVGERAVRLSGGQKQRIAIARALLKDAPILVLDEALSSVDAENEAIIQEALNRLMAGRTTLIIAHRLSSVVNADRILVLENGGLVESGAHAELVTAGGIYADLMAQQQDYADDHPAAHTGHHDEGHAGHHDEGHAGHQDEGHAGHHDEGHAGHHDEGHTGHHDERHTGHHDEGHAVHHDEGHAGHHDEGHAGHHDGGHDQHQETAHGGGHGTHHEAEGGGHHGPSHALAANVPSIEAFVPQPAHQGEGHHHHHDAHSQHADEQRGGAAPLGIFAVWRRLFGLVRPWRNELVLTFVLGLAHHGSIIGLLVIGALLVGQVITGGSLTTLLVLLGVFVPVVAFFNWAESWVAHDMAYRLLAEMRVDVYNKLDPLTPAYMVRRRSGDMVSIVGGDVETVEFFFAHTITPAFVAILVPVGVLATLAVVAWPIALVLSPFLVAVAISPFFAQKRSEKLGDDLRGQLGDVHAHMVDSIQGMREITAFGQGPARTGEMVSNSWNFAHVQLRFLKERAFQIGFIEGMTALGGLAVLTVAVWFMIRGDITRPELILSVILSVAAFAPISDIARTMKQLMETLAAARRLFVVHDEPVPVTDGPGIHAHEGEAQAAPAINFDQVAFSYGPGEAQALEDVSFSVEPGQTVALVGRSGAGKTTCANLVMRFWDPGQGSIRLGGHDLREFPLEELREQIGLVSQDTYLFNASIRDNLRLGRVDATDEEIEEAARQANAHDFITAFPDGYDTMVGERGMQLSGGQRQRLSIARALLKNSPVLILDEATSHLDAVNERQVRQALERLMEGRTTLVIAHRLSTIRDADRIVVLDDGRAVEQGNHHDLLDHHGLYSQLVATQLVGAVNRGGHNDNGHDNGHDDAHQGHVSHGDQAWRDLPGAGGGHEHRH